MEFSIGAEPGLAPAISPLSKDLKNNTMAACP